MWWLKWWRHYQEPNIVGGMVKVKFGSGGGGGGSCS